MSTTIDRRQARPITWRTAASVMLGVSVLAAGSTPTRAQRVLPASAPVDFHARALDGRAIHVGDREPVTLVNVFAIWCTTCRTEFKDLEQLSREFAGRMTVVAISIDEGSDDRVRRFVAGRRAGFPVAHDSSGAAARAFHTVGVPESYLVGRDGRVLWRRGGEIGPAIASLRQAIAVAR